MNKPITVARNDYIQAICDISNKSGLPAFVKVDVLERILIEVRSVADMELKRDEAEYRASLQKEKNKDEEKDEG